MRIRRGFVEISDGQVHYAECGPSDAEVTLLLHQSPRSWAEYRHVLPLLGLRYRTIAMDTLGFGDSVTPTWAPSVERWASAAVEFLQTLGITRCNIVGHHTGGVIALEIAASSSEIVERLVLSSTPYTDEEFRRARAERPPIDAVPPSHNGAHLAAMWQQRQAFYPSGRADLLQAFVLDALKVSDPEAGHRAVATYRMEDRIGLVVHDTLVIRATDDPFASPHADQLASRLARARVVEIDGGMVPLPDQMPEAFAGVVLDFLDGAT